MISKARINNVKPVPGKHTLQVEFANGKHYDVDLREHIRQFPVLKVGRLPSSWLGKSVEGVRRIVIDRQAPFLRGLANSPALCTITDHSRGA
ncbi:hypothetical protein [Pseudomonas sp.]|uniref:hypothetical protein n=1 Tax=Pseudomonas sp. TaxID=306 RepID=UPI003A9868EE